MSSIGFGYRGRQSRLVNRPMETRANNWANTLYATQLCCIQSGADVALTRKYTTWETTEVDQCSKLFEIEDSQKMQ